jgi:hypothetical protein
MTTVIFVHGTGTRGPAYESVYGSVRRQLTARRPHVEVSNCYWGHLASTLQGGGRSIPHFRTTGGAPTVAADRTEGRSWDLLCEDPFFELRALALRGPSSAGIVGPHPGDLLLRRAEQLALSGALGNVFAEAGLGDFFEEARRRVIDDPVCREAVRSAGAALGEHRSALARAIVAQAAILAIHQKREPVLDLDSDLRGAVIGAFVDALGGADKGLGGTVLRLLGGLAVAAATQGGLRYRGAVSGAIQPFIGDILLYQSMGKPIRDFLRDRIRATAGPVLLLAHSLGGIACVDLLIETPAPNVSALVTVGSQAPLLYELGCLSSLSYGQDLPTHFPRWLNLYDESDFLSYIGGELFPGRVEDVRVDNGRSFPASHSTYWTNPQTWDAVLPLLP